MCAKSGVCREAPRPDLTAPNASEHLIARRFWVIHQSAIHAFSSRHPFFTCDDMSRTLGSCITLFCFRIVQRRIRRLRAGRKDPWPLHRLPIVSLNVFRVIQVASSRSTGRRLSTITVATRAATSGLRLSPDRMGRSVMSLHGTRSRPSDRHPAAR